MSGLESDDVHVLVRELDAGFGARVRAARELLGLSQQYIADGMSAYGVTWYQTTVGKVESGERPAKLSEAVALAVMLGFGRRLDQLLYDDPASELQRARLAGAESELFRLNRYMAERRQALDEAYRSAQAAEDEQAES
jgi:transcriptional regulator with XRE-family HTH domain